jgi:ribonuclease P protein component
MTRIGRLKRRAEFLAAAAANRKWVAPGLVLQARAHGVEETRDEPVRVGFTASRKVGNAVMRNRAKRRLRAAAADLLKNAMPEARSDLVLIARPGTVTRDYQSLKADLARGLAKLGVVAKPDKVG